jgi:ribonuclease HI
VKGKWGVGVIIRNDEGLVMASGTWVNSRSDNVLEAEAFAIMTAMRFAKECGFRCVELEADNESLIQRIKVGLDTDRSYLGLFLAEIHRLQSTFNICRFSFIPRDGNATAHSLAQLAHSEPNLVWIEEVPLAVHTMYFKDLLN